VEAVLCMQLRFPESDGFGSVVFHPRGDCIGCTSGNLSWHTASGNATLYTFSVVRQSYHPFFRQKVPYAVAWVDLDEGPRLLTNITGVTDPNAELQCGQRLTVEWEEQEGLNIPLFRPA